MGQLKNLCLRIDINPTTGAKTVSFVCGQSEMAGHQKAVTLESTPRALTPGELSGTLQQFLASQQALLEAKLSEG